jgi:hypothetical protein
VSDADYPGRTVYEPDAADQQRLAELREQGHLAPDVA